MPLNLKQLKVENEATLSELGVNVISHLPQIDGLDEVSPKAAQIVASRACAMSYVIGMGYGAKKRKLRKPLKDFGLWTLLTPKEQKNLRAFSLNDQDKINYQWMSEALQGLAWSMGLLEMNHFKQCDEDELIAKLPNKTNPSEFIYSATLRPIEDIQKEADLLYRLHWYAKNKQLRGEGGDLNVSVIMERRRAIDWVYGTANEWEDVDLST